MAPIFVASSILSPKLSTHHMSTEEFPGILFNPREALRGREHHPPSKKKGKHTGALSLKDLHSFGLMFSFHIFFIVFGVFQWLINGHYPLSLSIDSIESLDSTSFYIYRIHRLHHSSAHTHTQKYCQTFQKQQMFNTPVVIIQFQKKHILLLIPKSGGETSGGW